jgi:hypothetical protein
MKIVGSQFQSFGQNIMNHEQLSAVIQIVNFFGLQTCECFSEMLRVIFGHCPGTLYGVAFRVVARRFLCLSDACANASQICKPVMIVSDTPDYTCVEHGCRILSLSATERNPLLLY